MKFLELLDHKKYELNLDDSTYCLSVEIYSDESILFILTQKNVLSNIQYKKEFKYETIIKELYYLKAIYTNIKEVFKFIDNSINKNRCKLVENKEKKKITLLIKILINDEEKESLISLPLEMTANKEIINLLIDEVNFLKKEIKNIKKEIEAKPKNIIEYESINKELIEKQNFLIRQNEEINATINELIILNKDKDNKIKELEQKIDNIIKENDDKIKNLEEKNIQIMNEKNEGNIKGNNKIEKEEENNKIIEEKKENNYILNEEEKNKNIGPQKENNLDIKKELIILDEPKEKNKIIDEKKENNKILDDKKGKKKLIVEKKIKNLKNELGDENNFMGNPENLKYIENITENHSCGGLLSNFDVFKGLHDNVEYIIYNNKLNFNLEIMRIKDKFLIKSLEGHKSRTTVIKYYKKNNKEDYILSCDSGEDENHIKRVIIWDIQDNFLKKIIIKEEEYTGKIFDSLILFDILKKNYILISSGNPEFSKLYEFEKEYSFINYMGETNRAGTTFIIHWENNKHYIIEFLSNIILIYNMLDYELYASFKVITQYKSGYIFNNQYLFAISEKSSIRIWDLINKNLFMGFEHESTAGFDIIPWNDNFTLFSTNLYIYILNNEDYTTKKIKGKIKGMKKLIIDNLGECLVGSDKFGNIQLYKIN